MKKFLLALEKFLHNSFVVMVWACLMCAGIVAITETVRYLKNLWQ